MWNDRTLKLLGENGVRRLSAAHVLVVGVGGVGGYAVEMLARSGIGHLTIMDADKVAESNINRQIIALHQTVGESKTELFASRIREINPEADVKAITDFLTTENIPDLFSSGSFDLVIDAIDTIAPKVALIRWCMDHRIPVISSMGAGGRIDPTKVVLTDLWKTANDGLARAVRERLKSEGLKGKRLQVVASMEAPRACSIIELDERNKRSSFGTIATVPATFGIFLAYAAIDKLLKS